jgi:hypothetical protein
LSISGSNASSAYGSDTCWICRPGTAMRQQQQQQQQ